MMATKKLVEIAFGIVGGIGFLWAGLAILVWDIGKLQQARNSRDWPQVEGIVTHSSIDKREREHRPHIVYTYTVGGTAYTSSQISFDLFDKPGGQGRIDSIMVRYPVGREVIVYYDPADPTISVLEPEVYSPFLTPLLFAALFLIFGTGALLATWRQAMQRGVVPQPGFTFHRRIAATVSMSALIYIILVLVSFDSSVRDTFVKAFGERPSGMPNILFVLLLQTVLYLPMPWVFWHMMMIIHQAIQDGRGIGKFSLLIYLASIGQLHPHLRRSRLVCIGGLVYFFAITGAWIIYAAARGI
jgi:hypothetical protein